VRLETFTTLPVGHHALPAGALHLWQVHWPSLPLTPGETEAALAAADQQAARRFVFDADRQRYAACRVALRHILGACLDRAPSSLSITPDAAGKPVLRGCGLRFNISHSREYLLVGAAWQVELGVDLEYCAAETRAAELLSVCAHPAERRAIRKRDEADCRRLFYRLWVRKEALLKAAGHGLWADMRSVCVLDEPTADSQTVNDADQACAFAGRRWQIRDVPAPPGFAAAVSYEGH
jgi:4'-phosphopantetheinyl transferase